MATTALRHPPERISDVYRYPALDLLPNWLATLSEDDRREALRHLEALRRIARRDARGWRASYATAPSVAASATARRSHATRTRC